MRIFIKRSLIALAIISMIFVVDSLAQKKSKSKPAASKSASIATSTSTPYTIKSGIVTYKSSVMGMAQDYTLYFDDFGKKECKYVYMKLEMFGQVSETSSSEINKDGYVYKIDWQKKTGTKTKSYSALGAAAGMPDPKTLTDDMRNKYQYKDLGKQEIMGKECQGVSMVFGGMKMEAWVWNNIALRIYSYTKDGSVMMEINAVKFEENVSIPADKFEIPSDIVITEG